jgi:hypothetical protein
MRASRCCARALAGGKEELLFCVFVARLKPCPDTCMAGGCGVAVQAVYARFALLRVSPAGGKEGA